MKMEKITFDQVIEKITIDQSADFEYPEWAQYFMPTDNGVIIYDDFHDELQGLPIFGIASLKDWLRFQDSREEWFEERKEVTGDLFVPEYGLFNGHVTTELSVKKDKAFFSVESNGKLLFHSEGSFEEMYQLFDSI